MFLRSGKLVGMKQWNRVIIYNLFRDESLASFRAFEVFSLPFRYSLDSRTRARRIVRAIVVLEPKKKKTCARVGVRTPIKKKKMGKQK